MECHFPAMGLLPCTESDIKLPIDKVGIIGINPPEEVTPLEVLTRGESSKGIGLWRRDLYGVGTDLAGKRRQRGWEVGMEDDIFVGLALDEAVDGLIRWDGGDGNEWFPRMSELPWYHGNI